MAYRRWGGRDYGQELSAADSYAGYPRRWEEGNNRVPFAEWDRGFRERGGRGQSRRPSAMQPKNRESSAVESNNRDSSAVESNNRESSAVETKNRESSNVQSNKRESSAVQSNSAKTSSELFGEVDHSKESPADVESYTRNLSFAELKALVEKLIDTVKCPVCFNPIQPKVSQCENGHGVCDDCRKKHNFCPVCRGTFLVFRNRLLDNVLELLPHNCSFTGCSEILQPGEDHENWCGFRLTNCKKCSWTGCGNEILKHIKFDHKDVTILSESNTDLVWSNIVPSRGHKRFTTCLTPISAHGYFFWMKETNDTQRNLFEKSFTFVRNGKKLEKTFVIKLVLKKLAKTYTVSTELTVDSLLGSDASDSSINLHSSTVNKFVTSENRLNYLLYVTETEKEDG